MFEQPHEYVPLIVLTIRARRSYAGHPGIPPLAVLARTRRLGDERIDAMRLRGHHERRPMARSGPMLLSMLVLGFVLAGGTAVLPARQMTAALAQATPQD